MKTWMTLPLLALASGLCYADFTNLIVYNTQPGKLIVGGALTTTKFSEEVIAVLIKGGATVKQTHRYSTPNLLTTHWTVFQGEESISFSRLDQGATEVSLNSSLALESLDIVRKDQFSFRGDLAFEFYGVLQKGGAAYKETLGCLDYAPDVCNISAELTVGSITCYGNNSVAGSPTSKPVVDRATCYLAP